MASDLPKRILVIRLGAIGDVVNALAFACALKAADPSVFIGWATHNEARPILVGNPVVDRVHLWDRKRMVASGLALRRELRAECYDAVVDLQRIAKSAVLARSTGVRRRIGFDAKRSKECSWFWMSELIPTDPADEHMLDWYLAAARHLGVATDCVRWSLPPAPEADANFARRFAGAAPILINLGASKDPNRWSADKFETLVRTLAARANQPVVLTGGPADRELFAELLHKLDGVAGVQDLVGRTSLLEFAALARVARTMVTCDTGPMHIAVSQGLKVVALFGPANPKRTGPYGEGHVIVRPPTPGDATSKIDVADVLAGLE